jgi:hypothetical protein
MKNGRYAENDNISISGSVKKENTVSFKKFFSNAILSKRRKNFFKNILQFLGYSSIVFFSSLMKYQLIFRSMTNSFFRSKI